MALMRADVSEQVVELLADAGYWNDPSVWRNFGDIENNYSTVGNQQQDPVAALIEKLINSLDARLLDMCKRLGIDPVSPEAPASIRDAMKLGYGGVAGADSDGWIDSWDDGLLRAEGRMLTLAATGHRPSAGDPCLTIADQGEGQEPDQFPNTFTSLNQSNKLRIRFVQGKYNMGGTGALRFCGEPYNFQLIVSKRNPALQSPGPSGRASEWGFTVVRRQAPSEGRRSSIYQYMAPVGASNGHAGGVLSFAADLWPIFPQINSKVLDPYFRESAYGSLIKLYEYRYHGTKTNIVRGGGTGLLSQLDIGIPELALPVRLYECRAGYGGHQGSRTTNLLGLGSRLSRDRKKNIEPGFPLTHALNLGGSELQVTIFAFKRGAWKEYKSGQGVLLSVNGQTHATYSDAFFTRKAVKMDYLRKDLLVVCDCSDITPAVRESLFMNSRDRVLDTPLARTLEKELERLIKDDEDLRDLRNRRRQEEVAEKLVDSQPLANVLSEILHTTPSLAKLLLQGVKLSSPFPRSPGKGTGAYQGSGQKADFHGKPYPTYLRFRNKPNGFHLKKAAHIGSRVRITFETDAADDYFSRRQDPAAMRLLRIEDDGEQELEGWVRRDPRSGIAHVTLPQVPADSAIGSVQSYRCEVIDSTQISAFVNTFELRTEPATATKPGGPNNPGGGEMLGLPNIVPVKEVNWDQHGFDEGSALEVKSAGAEDGAYDFFVNVDNKYLRTVMKESPNRDPKLLEAKFTYTLVLMAMAMLQEDRTNKPPTSGTDSAEVPSPEGTIGKITRAIAPVILPVLDAIGGLDLDTAS